MEHLAAIEPDVSQELVDRNKTKMNYVLEVDRHKNLQIQINADVALCQSTKSLLSLIVSAPTQDTP